MQVPRSRELSFAPSIDKVDGIVQAALPTLKEYEEKAKDTGRPETRALEGASARVLDGFYGLVVSGLRWNLSSIRALYRRHPITEAISLPTGYRLSQLVGDGATQLEDLDSYTREQAALAIRNCAGELDALTTAIPLFMTRAEMVRHLASRQRSAQRLWSMEAKGPNVLVFTDDALPLPRESWMAADSSMSDVYGLVQRTRTSLALAKRSNSLPPALRQLDSSAEFDCMLAGTLFVERDGRLCDEVFLFVEVSAKSGEEPNRRISVGSGIAAVNTLNSGLNPMLRNMALGTAARAEAPGLEPGI